MTFLGYLFCGLWALYLADVISGLISVWLFGQVVTDVILVIWGLRILCKRFERRWWLE